jgi:hypothetical protein
VSFSHFYSHEVLSFFEIFHIQSSPSCLQTFSAPMDNNYIYCKCRLGYRLVENSIYIDLVELGVKVKKEKVFYYWHLGKNSFYLLSRICQ